MSSKRVSELSVLSSVNVDDVLYIVDVSDTTDSTEGTSKQTLISSLADLIVPTDSEIKTAYENNPDTNAFTDSEKTKLSNTEVFSTSEQSKLSGIESGAEVNPTDSEIKTAYENNPNTNAFTDSEKTKLSGIESGAEVNPSISSGSFSLTDDSGGGLTINTLNGNYLKLENWCFINIRLEYPVNSDTNNAQLSNMPFSAGIAQNVGTFIPTGSGLLVNVLVTGDILLFLDVNGSFSNSDLSGIILRMSFVYEV